MTLPVTVSNSSQTASVQTSETSKSSQTAKSVDGSTTTVANAQSQLNAAIVQASFDTAISSKNEPLALLLKTAITGINEALKPTLGDNAIQNAMSQDNSPEATADRIVSMSTGFLAAYKSQHPEQNDQQALSSFMETIRGGFEKGYKEATDLLKGLGVFNGDVASGVEKTYSLVQKGYAAFEASQNKTATSTDSGSPDSSVKPA